MDDEFLRKKYSQQLTFVSNDSNEEEKMETCHFDSSKNFNNSSAYLNKIEFHDKH